VLFHTLPFAVLLSATFALYWFVLDGRKRAQNALIVVASYIFYGWWDWRFLSLLLASSVLDYAVGRALETSTAPGRRKALLSISLTGNLGLLATFKYYDFFIDSLVTAAAGFDIHLDPARLGWILPVGISFYTFQTLSYAVDVYRRDLAPTRDFIAFMAYVSFFPQLVAGPIERATNLLPQFERDRSFDIELAKDGLRQMLWGFFKKVVIADSCAPLANQVFAAPAEQSAPMLVLGVVFFAFQIYGDFSGYSDIAVGCARLFGFTLMRNFAYPYFSRDIGEFWRRWHISLSTWFRDYVYVPLGGSRVSTKSKAIRNVAVVFILSGIWHGANWTFLFWGAYHALLFVPLMLINRNRAHLEIVAAGRRLPTLAELLRIITTFALVCVGWVLFRARDIHEVAVYLRGFVNAPWSLPQSLVVYNGVALITALVAMEWGSREKLHPLERPSWRLSTRWAVYLALSAATLMNMANQDVFIYFQF